MVGIGKSGAGGGRGCARERVRRSQRGSGRGRRGWLTLGLLCAAPTIAWAQDVELIEARDAWAAYVARDGGSKVCFARAVPERSAGDYTSRGDIALTVSHRPGDGVRNEVSMLAGYTYRPGSEVTVRIGGESFSLFVDGDAAWTRDADDDEKLVSAIRRGSEAIVVGISNRGTETTDEFSLKGSSNALRLIDENCPR